jgi:hypothetical protein
MSLAWLSLTSVLGHVPAFEDGQCTPFKKHHHTSQVVYQKLSPGSSGGAEIHCSLESCPFDYANGELLDVGAVFNKKYPLEHLEVRIGCLGCAPEDSQAQAPPLTLEWGDVELEPFTGSQHVSALRDADATFNTSQLDPSGPCTSAHFGIVLTVKASMGEDVYWAPVLGLGETFSATEVRVCSRPPPHPPARPPSPARPPIHPRPVGAISNLHTQPARRLVGRVRLDDLRNRRALGFARFVDCGIPEAAGEHPVVERGQLP